MRIKDPISEAEEPYNLVPLTDMVFNLLIFFMAATTFAQVEKELGVQLPRAAGASLRAASPVPQNLTINVDQAGAPVVRRVKYSLPELAGVVKAAAEKNPRLLVVIRADRRGTVGNLDAVLDVCKRAGVGRVEISYVTGGAGS